MAITGKCNQTLSLPGVSISTTIDRSASGGVPPQDAALPAAKAGSLTTRTSDTEGELTMTDTDHGLENGDKITIFWADGIAYQATVGTVEGKVVPFTGAKGDNLPPQDTAITAGVITVLDVDFDGDKLKMFAASSNRRGHVVFEDVGDNVLSAAELVANEPYLYIDGVTSTNPLAGNPVDEVHVANGDATAAASFKMGGVYDSES
jgi:hypothetical protein